MLPPPAEQLRAAPASVGSRDRRESSRGEASSSELSFASSGPGFGWFAVGTSLHPDAQGLAAQDRWITWAVLVSLLLHTPLFLSSGIWRRGLLDGTAAPPLLVHLEPSELPENTQAESMPVVVEEHAIPL